jgi:ABC-type phosphate transport system auxiliary subunit
VIELDFKAIEKKAEEVALQKKLEIKDELTKELATKADIVRLEGEIKADIARLEGEIQTLKADFEGKISVLRMEFRVYFVILLAVIILSSPRAVDLIGKILGVVK